jgi:2Fe-2S ferredoxin
MVCIRFVQPDGDSVVVDADVGASLMVAATTNDVDGILAECGGSMVCGTCHVYVDEPWFTALGPVPAMEAEMLEYGLHPQPNSRLSCQIAVGEALEGLCVRIPVSQR